MLTNDECILGSIVYYISDTAVSHGTFLDCNEDIIHIVVTRENDRRDDVYIHRQLCFSNMNDCFSTYASVVELINVIKKFTEQTAFSAELVFNAITREPNMRPAVERIYRLVDMLKAHDAKAKNCE